MKLKSLLLFALSLCFLSGCAPSKAESPNQPKNDPVVEKEKPDYFTLFSFNDIHGSIEPFTDNGSYEAGAARLKYAIEKDVDYDKENSILLCGGDCYQGGYLSYKDKQMVSSVLNQMGVDAMAIGNHEFDWGIPTMKEMFASLSFPVLGANVLKNGVLADFVSASTILETTSLKIGVVGAIGPSVHSSIKSTIVSDYAFSSSVSYLETELDKMKDCDFRILLSHDSISNDYLKDVVDTLAKDSYSIDGIVGGHTHLFEAEEYQGVPFVQAGSNSKGYAKIKFDTRTKKCVSFQYDTFDSSDCSVADDVLDQGILSTIEKSVDLYHPKEEIGISLDSTFSRYNQMYRLIPTTMLDKARRLGIKKNNPLLVIHNTGGIRDSLPGGELTRERIGKCCPFDNRLQYIRSISGSCLYSLCGSLKNAFTGGKYCFLTEDGTKPSASLTYDVISIDYCIQSTYFVKAGFPRYSLWSTFEEDGEDVIMTDVVVSYFENLALSGVSTVYALDYSIE